MKKFLAMLLLAAIAMISVLACSQNDAEKDNGAEKTNNDDNAINESEDGTEEPATEKLPPDLPDINFGDVDFVVLLTGNWESSFVSFPYVVAEELNGEIVNDAVYMRNVMISEKYGVNIKEIDETGQAAWGTGNGYKTISKDVLAGNNSYDAGFIATYDICTLASEGYLHDLFEAPHIDLDKPWWDARTKRDLLIGNKMYFTNGDVNILNNECTFCILFNKKLIQDYDMEVPYELVKTNKWTLDKFFDMSKAASKDLNGDGKMDSNDRFGLLMWQDSAFGVNIGAGNKIATVENGAIELSLYNENSIAVYSKYLEFLQDKTAYLNILNMGGKEIEMFASNQALFHTRYITTVSLLRNMETDFGILPYPKLNENQKEYYSNIHGYGDSFVCIPKTAENVEMSGTILEALAAESMNSVTPAYYDVTLTGKFFRDDESREMLDILFSTRVYDVGLFYQVGDYMNALLDMVNNQKKDFTSTYEKNESKAREQIEKINRIFSENN
jgi:hypothetical protein